MGHLFIRADATPEMGTGHIMRCLAVAQAWRTWGGSVTFISKYKNNGLSSRLTSEGFHLAPLQESCPHPKDILETLAVLQSDSSSEKSDTWIILDGYHFTKDYQKKLLKNGYKVLVIDDNNHLPEYSASILLNQNICADQFMYTHDKDTTMLLGPRYTLLRQEFLSCPQNTIPDTAQNILVTMGGADIHNLSLTVVKSLQSLNRLDLNVKVVVGTANPHLHILSGLDPAPLTIDLVQNGDMPKLMQWADMAVTAGGTTCLELAFMGVPAIAVITADNQINPVAALEKKGVLFNLGHFETIETDRLATAISDLISNITRQKEMADNGRRLIDGKGAKRVIRQMLVKNSEIRRATMQDAQLIWELANDPFVRESSFSSQPIAWDTHISWFQTKISDPDFFLYIVLTPDQQLIGQIRFEKKEKIFFISYSLAEKFRSLGLGTVLLKVGMRKLQSETGKKILVQGEVKPQNAASIKSFEKCGFEMVADNPKLVYQLQMDSNTYFELPEHITINTDVTPNE